MSKPWFTDSDIALEEETEVVSGDGDTIIASIEWTASINSRLRTGDPGPGYSGKGAHVSMSRTGRTAEAAMVALKEAVEAQGWELR
jgi:hypothetical protein